MIETVKKMGGGGCSGETFKIYQEAKGLIAECCECKSTSTIRASVPEIEIDWLQGDGLLSITPGRR